MQVFLLMNDYLDSDERACILFAPRAS